MSDYEVADRMGFKSLLANVEYYDVLCLHVVGIDHVGHKSGDINNPLLNEVIEGIEVKI